LLRGGTAKAEQDWKNKSEHNEKLKGKRNELVRQPPSCCIQEMLKLYVQKIT